MNGQSRKKYSKMHQISPIVTKMHKYLGTSAQLLLGKIQNKKEIANNTKIHKAYWLKILLDVYKRFQFWPQEGYIIEFW